MKPIRIIEFLLLFLAAALLNGCSGSSGSSKPPQPDFTLTVSASSVFVPIGVGSGSLQVSIATINGFTGPVSVTFQGLPSGVTMMPASPFSINAGSNQTVTLNAAPAIPPSLQNVTVSGMSGSLGHSQSVSLSVAMPSYAYVSVGYDNQPPFNVSAFAVDANTGAQFAVAGSPFALTGPPLDMAVVVEPAHTFLFALLQEGTGQSQGRALVVFGIDPGTGSLTPIVTIDYGVGTSQTTLAVDPAAKFLYVRQNQACILAYVIDPVTGNLSQASCSGDPQANVAFVVTPPGDFAYSAGTDLSGVQTLDTYSVNRQDGSLTTLQSSNNLGDLGALFSDPQGHALYNVVIQAQGFIGSCGGFVEIWTINQQNGGLSGGTTPYAGLCSPISMAFDPADHFAYVPAPGANTRLIGGNGVFAGTLDVTTGDISNVSGSPFATDLAPSLPLRVAVEPSQRKFLLALRDGTPKTLIEFAINSTSGALAQVLGVQTTFPANSVAGKLVTVAPQ